MLTVLCKRGSLAAHVHQPACAGAEMHFAAMYWFCVLGKIASSGMLWPCSAEHEVSAAGQTSANAAASCALLHCLPATAHKKQRGASCRVAAEMHYVHLTFRAVVLRCVQAAWHHSPAGSFRQCMWCAFFSCLRQRMRRGFSYSLVHYDSSCTHTSVHFLQSLLSSAPVAYQPGGLGFLGSNTALFSSNTASCVMALFTATLSVAF